MANKNIRLVVQPVTDFFPPHVEGDTDFGGHGPSVHLETHLIRLGNVLQLSFFVHFRETKADYTKFMGSDARVVFDCDREFPGWQLASLVPNQRSSYVFDNTLSGYGNHTYRINDYELINHVTFEGDENGGWGGGDDHPGIVELGWNPIELVLENDQSASAVGVRLRTPVNLKPEERTTKPWNQLSKYELPRPIPRRPRQPVPTI